MRIHYWITSETAVTMIIFWRQIRVQLLIFHDHFRQFLSQEILHWTILEPIIPVTIFRTQFRVNFLLFHDFWYSFIFHDFWYFFIFHAHTFFSRPWKPCTTLKHEGCRCSGLSYTITSFLLEGITLCNEASFKSISQINTITVQTGTNH